MRDDADSGTVVVDILFHQAYVSVGYSVWMYY